MPKHKKPLPPNSSSVETCDVTASDIEYKLVSLTVIENATQTNVTGAKNWACVKKDTDDVIVKATTDPDTEDAWKQISWTGDSGESFPGKPNQRKLSRKSSKKYQLKAELGGVEDSLTVWVLWADVTIHVSGTTPANAVQFGAKYDGTENLGAKTYHDGKKAVGKVVPTATITPGDVHDVVKAGWVFKRERWSHDWEDGTKSSPGNGEENYWNTTWVDDTSYPQYQKPKPDANDKIYDRDAPNIAAFGTDDAETYNNFRQWVEWNSADANSGGVCSDRAGWYWKGRWKQTENPQVTLAEVDTRNINLPDQSHFHP